MTSPDGVELRQLAEKLAREAGRLAEELRVEATADFAGLSNTTKSSSADLVTMADKAAEAHIIGGLLAERGDDGILGEEGGSAESRSGVRWIIDPIDGTTNFVYNIPAYSVSIAAEVDGELVAGVVFDPRSDRLFSASLGDGASLAEQGASPNPISVRSHADLATSLVATGFAYVPERRHHQAQVLVHLLPKVRDIRRFGSAALDLCAVAEGRVDAYYERGLNPWDLAGGQLIASEAGAFVGDLRGGAPSSEFALAASPGIAMSLVSELQTAGADQGP